MVLRRKIYSKLLDWKNDSNGNQTILLEGARRIGKSTIVEEFAENEYTSYIVIDFAKKNSEVEQYFINCLNDLDTFFMMLSTYYGVKLSRRNSLIIFDEVQMFPLARAAIKYLVADGRYDENLFDEVIQVCKLQELIKDKGLNYKLYAGSSNNSGGQKQRICTASMLIRKPNYLLLDEPTSALDYNTREKFSNALNEFAKKYDLGLVIVSHNNDTSVEVGRKVVVRR